MRFSIPSLILPLATILAACTTTKPEAATGPLAVANSVFRNHVAFTEGRIGNSRPLWFLVDTGANRSALDISVAAELGLETGAMTTVQGTAGTVEVPMAKVPLLRIGGLAVRDIEPTIYDLSGSLAPEQSQIAGIIGFDVMKDHAVLFDPANDHLAFAASPEAFELVDQAIVVPFRLDNDIPLVDAFINDLPVQLRLDTGASLSPGKTTFVNITRDFYDRLKTVDPGLEPFRWFTATGTGGEIRIPVVKAESFRLGSMDILEPQLIIQPRAGYFANEEAVGFIGGYSLQTFSRFIVDYPQKRLILIP